MNSFLVNRKAPPSSTLASTSLFLPRPILLGLVSRLHPWLRGILLRFSEDDGTAWTLDVPLLRPP